jgi:hypothetical protein
MRKKNQKQIQQTLFSWNHIFVKFLMIFYSLKFLIIAQSSVLTLRLRDESCSTLETRRVN